MKAPPGLVRGIIASIATIAVFLYGVRNVAHFTVDDAGISYAYAKHLADGLGLVPVVGGAVVEGYSNPLWVLLLSVVHLVGLNVPPTAKYLGMLLGLGSVVLAMLTVQRLDDRTWRQASVRDLAVVVLLGLYPEVLFWMPSGLENGLFLFLLMLLVWMDLTEAKRCHWIPYSFLVAFAVAIARPEGALYGAAIGCIKFVHALTTRRQRHSFLVYAAGFTLCLAIYHSWHAWVFQLPFPNTYYAKSPGLSAEKLEAGLDYVWKHAQGSHAIWLSPLVLLGAFRHFRSKAPLLAVMAVALAFACFSGGDWMPFGRFFSFPLVPASVLAMAGVNDLSRLVTHIVWRSRKGSSYIASAGALAVATLWFQSQDGRLEKIRKDQWCHYCNRAADVRGIRKLQDSLDLPAASLVIHDFGAASWASSSRFRPYDFLGLCDHTIARSRSLLDERPSSAHRLLYQYLVHEQDRAPTFLYFPGSWWPELVKSTEFLEGYYKLPKKYLGKNHRRDGVFVVHRSAFIDFFPPVERFEFRNLDDHFTSLGVGLNGKNVAGGHLDVAVPLLKKRSARLGNSHVKIRLVGGDWTVPGPPHRLFRGVPGLARQWLSGEPYLVDASFRIPLASATPIHVELGLSVNGRRWSWHRMATVAAGAEHTWPARPTGRFASNLPGSTDPALAEVRAEASRVIFERYRRGDFARRDPALATRAEHAAKRLERRGDRQQAYLGYVLAAQMDRRRFVRWLSPLWSLRPLATNYDFVMELALLRRTYESGHPAWRRRLVRHYLDRGYLRRARYFAGRRDDSTTRSRAESWVARGQSADVVVWQDFEGDRIPAGWRTTGSGMALETVGLDDGMIRGHHGRRMLSSYKGKSRQRRGIITSPTIPAASAMSFAIGGSHVGVRAELLADGAVVRTVKGPGSHQLEVVLWDLDDFAGKSLQVRIVDDSPRAFIVADCFVLWN